MIKINQKFNKILFKYIILVQKILVNGFLLIIYYFGFGITFLFMFFINSKLLFNKRKNKTSFWKNSKGYECSINECERQS
jgi:ABC-type Na+ efflux pump permease subunit